MYHDAEEDYWLLPTAEVALTTCTATKSSNRALLPINYVAYTPCFRREKMSAGRDVRGIKRGHQFDKVEMYSFVEPEKSAEALEQVWSRTRGDCRGRWVSTYRVVELCTGDLGFNAAKTYDIEIWAPGSASGSSARRARTARTSRPAARTYASAARRAASRSTRIR